MYVCIIPYIIMQKCNWMQGQNPAQSEFGRIDLINLVTSLDKVKDWVDHEGTICGLPEYALRF